ncbi:TetR/AcrR family transcriptional regulator [Pseudooceanicola sp. C21-150M6]|uniref:TetR/AcrR family transcriptional regulator n=1 Tax=Pseudooceanicola sp. C21-150M6 TaxID=3434355 RepID=UPI003D7F89A9
MPRKPAHSRDDLLDRALMRFWDAGYEATSIDDLVKATGGSLHALYKAFGSKHGLFLECFDRYHTLVVAPAIAPLDGAGMSAISEYFERQIKLAEGKGLPGIGCFVGNAATETAPHDPEVAALVARHEARLDHGFAAALLAEGMAPERAAALARVITTFATGLWARSRAVTEAEPLRRDVQEFLSLLERSLS